MKSFLVWCEIRSFCLVAATLFLALPAHGYRCNLIFRESLLTQTLLDPSWLKTAEREYSSMLVELGVVAKPGQPLPEHNAGTIIYSYARRHPAIDSQLLTVGFSVADSASPARFEFPQSFSEIVTKVQSRNFAGSFKIATYNTSVWHPLDARMPIGATTEVATDLPFLSYANMVAQGYTPLWPGRSSLGLLHDLAHVTEYLEHPEVFPALQRFFKNHLAENSPLNSDNTNQMRSMQRAKFFNEVSYILKPTKYKTVDSLLVSEGIELGSLPVHTMHLRKAMTVDLPRTLEKIRFLTDAFDELFYRHGGGARDVFAIDTRLSHGIIEAYVAATKADPLKSTTATVFPSGFLAEFVESPEGLKRQIQFLSSRLQNERSEELQNLLAFRVAQLEVAILTQRKLELSQVDVIQDSMLPLGAVSKTSRYMQAYLPPNAKLHQLYGQPDSP